MRRPETTARDPSPPASSHAGRTRVTWGATILLASCAASCSRTGPDEVANGFVDAYYVEFDLERAAKLAVGTAATRLREERALADEARSATSLESGKARVYYGKPERRQMDDDKVHYSYPLEIRHGASAVTREAVVMVAVRDGAWKVINFRETQAGDRGATRTSTGPATR